MLQCLGVPHLISQISSKDDYMVCVGGGEGHSVLLKTLLSCLFKLKDKCSWNVMEKQNPSWVIQCKFQNNLSIIQQTL